MAISAINLVWAADKLALSRRLRLKGEICASSQEYSRAVDTLKYWLADDNVDTLLSAWEGSMANHPMELEEWRGFDTKEALRLDNWLWMEHILNG